MNNRTLKGIAFLLFAFSLLFWGGCNGKEDPKNEKMEEVTNKKVTFQVTLPQGDSYLYRGTTQPIHDAEEWGIKKLTMYTFTSDGSKLKAIDEITMSDLKTIGDATYAYTKEFTQGDEGIYRFLFVANESVAGVTVGSINQADFEKKLMSKIFTNDGTSKDLLYSEDATPDQLFIPMTGIAEQNESTQIAVTGTTEPVKVTLTRVVARIDISNHIPNMSITKVSIKNTYDKSYLFPTHNENGLKTYDAPSDATKVSMSKGYKELPSPFKGQVGKEGTLLKKAFYLYEGPQPKEEAKKGLSTTIVLEGTLDNGRKATFEIPFVSSSKTFIPIDIKRNYLYHLIIGDNRPLEPGSKISFQIEDEPWNSVILTHEMPIIDFISDITVDKDCYYDPATRTIYSNNCGKYYAFELETRLKNHTKFTFRFLSSESGLLYEVTPKKDSRHKDYAGDYYVEISSEGWSVLYEKTITKDKAIFEVYSDADPNIKRYLTLIYDLNYNNPIY